MILTAPLRAWNKFWFAPTSARPLGALRVLFGLIVLLDLAILATDLDAWFTDSGHLRGTEARELAGPVWSAKFDVPMRWSPLQTYRGPVAVRCVFGATALAAVVFTLGWRTRVAGMLLYAGLLSIHHANILTCSGADVLLMVVAFLLMLSPCGAALSLDAIRRNRQCGGPVSALVAPWAQRLIAIQISVVYFVTALLKARGASWSDGTALHYILNNGEARRFTLGLTAYPTVLSAMTVGAMFLEFALAFLLWVRAARALMIAAGLALHLGITLTVNIPIFGELIVACYLAFLSPTEWDAIARTLDPRRWFRREASIAVVPGRVDRGHAASAPHFGTTSEIPSSARRDSSVE
jgi:Vitamin K-dependent gamma-carboxylase